MLFGFLSSLRAIQVLYLVKVVSSGSSVPTEGPGGFPRRDYSFGPFSSHKSNSCFTCVVMLIASMREARGFLKETALSLLSIQGLVNSGALVLALGLAQGQRFFSVSGAGSFWRLHCQLLGFTQGWM